MPIKKEYNLSFFKKWSEDMAYILGFIYADGNLVKTKRGTYFTAFYTADYDLIFSMREKIGSNHKISFQDGKGNGVYRLQIGSKELFYVLGKIGITPNKSRRMRLPKIPKKFVGDFVRGYFDGDGCVWTGEIHKNRKTRTNGILVVFTSASTFFLKSLSNLLNEFGLVGGSLFKSKQGNYGRLQYSTLNALKLYKIMYNRPCTLLLTRKKVIFEDFIKLRP